MKRLVSFVGISAFCFLLSGCGGDTHEDLIKDTIQLMTIASTEVGNIKKNVQDAIKVAKGGGNLDLKKAIESTEKLKETGAEAQKLKQRIETVRSLITEENKRAYADRQKANLNDAFKELRTQREGLRTALQEAEDLPGDKSAHKKAVAVLREKLTEAEGPFEALTRN